MNSIKNINRTNTVILLKQEENGDREKREQKDKINKKEKEKEKTIKK